MSWNRLAGVCLLASTLTLLGCPSDPEPTDPPDASTPAEDAGPDGGPGGGPDGGTEWDGGAVPLEERGNFPTDPGRLSSCTFITDGSGGECGDPGNFNLSACDQPSLANAGTEGLYLLDSRQESADGGRVFTFANMLQLSNDGGPQVLNGRVATEQQLGNARFLSTLQSFPDGGTRRVSIATCEAPRAPEFTGCYLSCRNGRLSARATFASERMKWARGESEASGLERVSESFVSQGYPADVYVTKGHAYVVSINSGTRTGGLTVFDVSDKTAPVLKKTVQMANDTYWNGVWAKDDALYVASANRGVLVFDIRNPADPQFVRNVPEGNTNVHTVFVEGNRLFATDTSGVLIYDVSNALAPVELNRFGPYPNSSPHDLFAVGDRLYVNYTDEGFIVADMSNMQDLRTLGTYNFANHYSHANAVGTFAGRTIAFMGGEGVGEHLRVLDITNPAQMVKIGAFQLRPAISIHNFVLVGQRLYLAWYQEGVRVLDVSNPTQPRQVAYFNTFRETDPGRGGYFDGAIGIRVPGDGYIYTVDTSRGLLILREK